MGSVGFGVEDESQPHGNLPGKLLAGCGSVCHVTVPRKQRSSIEKRGKHGVELRGKDRAKKLKLNMGQVTKDEEEVAEALYALANMFAGTNKVKKPLQLDGTSNTKSEVKSEGRESIASEEKKPKISNSKVPRSETSESLRLSYLVSSPNPGTLPHDSHPVGNDTGSVRHTPVNQNKSLKRCGTHVNISRLIKTWKLTEKNEDLLEPRTRLPTSGEPQSHFSTQDEATDVNGRHGEVPLSGIVAHSAAVKDTVENKKDIVLSTRSFEDPQPVSERSSGQRGYNFLSLSSGASELDTIEVGDRARRSREDPKASHFHFMQTQNESSQIFSAAKGNTFHGNSSVVPGQQVKLPHFMSSTIDGIFLPPTARDQTESQQQQQQWAARLHAQYNNIWGVGAATTQLPDWLNGARNSSLLNYAQAMFPHLHTTLASKYQQTPPRSQQQSPATDWSMVPHPDAKRDLHPPRFPSGFERNGVGLYTENAHHLWLPCNPHP